MKTLKINNVDHTVDDAVAEKINQLKNEVQIRGEVIILFTDLIQNNFIKLGQIRDNFLSEGKRARDMLLEPIIIKGETDAS